MNGHKNSQPGSFSACGQEGSGRVTRASVHLSNVLRICPLAMVLRVLMLSAKRIAIGSREELLSGIGCSSA
jgi:hypothetical protein